MKRTRGVRELAVAAAMAASVLVGGCHKATFVRDVPPAGPVQSEWVRFHLFGLVGVHDLEVRDYCPNGDVRILRTGSNLATSLVTIVTVGIYSPRKLWIQCGDTAAARARPTRSSSGEVRDGPAGADDGAGDDRLEQEEVP